MAGDNPEYAAVTYQVAVVQVEDFLGDYRTVAMTSSTPEVHLHLLFPFLRTQVKCRALSLDSRAVVTPF